MKYLPVRGFFIFRLTSHSCDPKREINFKRPKKPSKAVSTCETWYINNEIGWTFYFKKRRVWQSGLCNLDTCEYNGYNVNLNFHSAASVLRGVLDGVVTMTSAEEFQEFCSWFWNTLVLVVVIGRNTTAIADMDPGSIALNGLAGRICWKDWTFYQPPPPLPSRTFR